MFLLFVISLFAITPTYYSEQNCDLYTDLENYERLLQNDLIVKEFLKKFPHALSYVDGVDESIPLKASVVYSYDDNLTKTELWIYIRETSPENENDCFWPVQYTYKYDDGQQHTSYYSWEKQQLVDFMSDVVFSPYVQLNHGIDPQNIQCRNELTLIIKYNNIPACVTSETKEKLIERGWAKPT